MFNYGFIMVIVLISTILVSFTGTTTSQLTNYPNQTSSNFTNLIDNFELLNTSSNMNNNNFEQFQNFSESNSSRDMISLKNTSSTLQSEGIYKDNLTKLYDSTIDSIVKISSSKINNQSDIKMGTGFIVNINGTLSLLTSNSLVSRNDTTTITLSNGDIYESKLKGYDPVTNVALLSVEEIPLDKIVPLNLANSSKIRVGQEVVTIDRFEGLPNLLTSGIISGSAESIPTYGQNVSSTTTKIPNGIVTNLGSASGGYGGGPILNVNGQVIGMNVQNHSSGEKVFSPISFAIPSNSLNKIIPMLDSQGYYLHPWLGASGTDVTPDIAKTLKLDETKGFLVISVSPQSPAKLAGILGGDNNTSINGRPITLGGDIILKVDNKDVQDIHEILSYIEDEKNVGDNLVITVLRNGILQTINVVLEANPNYVPSLN